MRADPEIFLRRAGEEARRYGADPWIFVRELVQNARDAGASRVEFSLGSGDGREWIRCRDDGGGLDREVAARFLFTLYASSKSAANDAGRFGVGFWSILRFAPTRIEVRSVPRSGEGFRVVLDGGLRLLEEATASGPPGTEVILERPGSGAGLTEALEAAARDQVGLVTRKGGKGEPLEVTVEGRPVNRELALPTPSSRFSGPGFRGVVGLGDDPRVELFACGLKVREAASLDDLLAEGRRPTGSRRSARAAGLVPRVLLDGDRLELLLARGDARDDRALEKLVARARRELDRLITRALDRRMPRTFAGRWAERAMRWLAVARSHPVLAVGAVAGAVGLAAVLFVGTLPQPKGEPRQGAEGPALGRPLTDLAVGYRGPDVGLSSGSGPRVELHYAPPDRDLLLAVLRLDGPSLQAPAEQDGLAPAPPRPCAQPCVELELTFDTGSGVFRLPVPTGAAIDPASVRLDETPAELWLTARGEGALRLSAPGRGRVRYRAGPPPARLADRPPQWPNLPAVLAAEAVRLGDLPARERVATATAVVRRLVRYDRSEAVVARFRAAEAAGLGVLDRALAVGAGDCDVQNAVLAALLTAAGSPAWLAVGYVGHDGRALPGLHAWAEVEGQDGRRSAADASVSELEDGVSVFTEGPAPVRAPSTGSGAPDRSAGPVRRVAVIVGIAVFVLATVTWFASRLRVRRRLALGEPLELTELVRGALEHEDAFAGAPSITSRPLIPCLGGKRVSLARARAIAGGGQLLASAREGDLAIRAARAGKVVVDAATAEGAVAASVLAAVDLDWWQAALDRIESDTRLVAADRLLRTLATGVRLAAAPGLGTAMRCLDLVGIGCGRDLVIAVDPGAGAAAAAGREAASHPATATLRLLERACERLDIPGHRGRRARRAVAAAALGEAVGA